LVLWARSEYVDENGRVWRGEAERKVEM